VDPSTNPTPPKPIQIHYSIEQNLSEKELDEILVKSFDALLTEQNIDSMIDEFFLSLK